ncbi:thermonuclease family protein [Microbispora sp. NPDC046933]|uniref:thermonuclease family protein n=1 Tax=Microbispora sp. NPDC046933 TaxID=3155618 RepID=UPI0033FE40A5
MRFPSHALAVLATAALAVPVAASTSAFAAATVTPSPSPTPSQTPAATSPSPSASPSASPVPQPTVTVTKTITPKATKSTAAKTTKYTRPKTVPKDAVQVTVKKIVSGDTADVVTASGRTVRIGLLDAEAPGKGACWSEEAFARLMTLLPPGKPAYVRAAEQVREKGRILIYLWSSTGVYVNGDMVRNGLAQPGIAFYEHSYTEWQWQEQARAQTAKVGVWSGCWAPDAFGKQNSVQAPPGADDALTPAPIEPADASLAPPGTTYSPEPIPPGSTFGPVATVRPSPSPSPSASPNPSPSPGGSTDPRYNTCEEANAHGYGPYYRGTDPEYDWYIDRDGDGKVCET